VQLGNCKYNKYYELPVQITGHIQLHLNKC